MSIKKLEENKKKIAFIMCSNDKQETEECLFYLRNLKIPKGYDIEIIPVYNAVSMAAGYNMGMRESDAKYKVYLHQDTFIIDTDFIYELLKVFEADSQIGMVGCVGHRRMPKDGFPIDSWNTGKVYHNLGSCCQYEHGICEVDAVDGLLIATQYDIPWREDLFQGWDYYDISQCYEFHRQGRKVVVPKQEGYWCYHDNKFSRLADYDRWRKKFVAEYQDVYPFEYIPRVTENQKEMEELIKSLSDILKQHLTRGEMQEFHAICSNSEIKQKLWAREFCEISNISRGEENGNTEKHICQKDAESTLKHLRRLRHLLKRVEYNAGKQEDNLREIIEGYSMYAICIVSISYCKNRKKIYESLQKYVFAKSIKVRELFLLEQINKEETDLERPHMCPLVLPEEDWKKVSEKQILIVADTVGKQREKVLELCRNMKKHYEV
ncbi:glycosyltransferase family protein [Roseburia sp. MSJ-14]|uniref:glycosyltransferase family protein n=1 Tax=Roseburia sp. MSJ-14 TaxID=2841514 RepID=UPI00209F9EBD|nr:glycosyltransferase family protein [Roseburia sp. MSJ-14]